MYETFTVPENSGLYVLVIKRKINVKFQIITNLYNKFFMRKI